MSNELQLSEETKAKLDALANELGVNVRQDMADGRGLSIENDLAEEVAPPPPPPSPTALVHDHWSMRRGKEWLRDKGVKAVFKDDEKKLNNMAADFLDMTWNPSPELVSRCEDERFHKYMKTIMESHEYRSIHADTMLDEMASEIAATSFAQQWYVLKATEQPKDELDAEAQMHGAAKNACQNASGGVQELKDTRDALGIGNEANAFTPTDIQRIRSLFGKIKNNEHIREAMKLAGKYKRLAQSLQASKSVHGLDEVVGVELGNDISLITTGELVYLCDEDLEMDFTRRLVEGELEIEELMATEKEAKGPIVVVIDESGSMGGEPINNAKAMAMAMLWIAQHQKRPAAIVSFADGDSHRKLVINPEKPEPEKLIEWLGGFLNGGTDPYIPFEWVPQNWETTLQAPKGKADMILITDAAIHIPESTVESFKKWKEESMVKLYSIVISSEAGSVEPLSDRTWVVNNLNIDTAGIGDCLSI